MSEYVTKVGLDIIDEFEVFRGFFMCYSCSSGVVFVRVVNLSKSRYFTLTSVSVAPRPSPSALKEYSRHRPTNWGS